MNTKSKPNVVFVLTDDQGYGDLGCHGNDVIQTPNIDTHYGDAVRFTDFHVGTTCAPTRSGLLTGHFCNSAGVWHTIGGRSLLREDEWTLANALREAGYRTGHFGKWHLGDNHPYQPHDRGFETSIFHAGGGIGNTGDHWGNDYFDDTYFANGVPTPFEGYCTDVFFREGMKFIEEHAKEPFFCYIATNAPHGPLNIDPSYVTPYLDKTPHEDRARFYGMITNIDDNFGLLQGKLESLGIADNTILVFMTDNGTATGVELDAEQHADEGPGSFNAGMRGKKGSPYDGGHRVPFIVRYPNGNLKGGRDITELTSYVDFMPTILDLCDVSPPEDKTFHGRSLLPLVKGSDDPLLSERFIVSDTQRIARPMKWRKSSVMQTTWRLVNGTELYDVAADPGQKNDVAPQNEDRVRRMREGYDAWWDLVSDQFGRDIPIAVGQDDTPVKLTTHDIRNEDCAAAWNHRQVRQGITVSGYWEVDVRRAGTYTVQLRRWPEEAGHCITEGIDGDDVEWRKDAIKDVDASHYTGGVAIPIKWAQLDVGGETLFAEVGSDDVSTDFIIELEKGQDRLFAAYYDKAERTMAPYYVYVTKAE